MRSQLVSMANVSLNNRFLLCGVAADGARRLHRGSTSVQNTINQALQLICEGKLKPAAKQADLKEVPEEVASLSLP